MIARARFANMLSFDAEQTISFVAGKTHSHKDHLHVGTSRNDPDLLKTAIVYGANASGKSNLIKCFDLVKNMVLVGTRADDQIRRSPFKLRQGAFSEPSRFEIELKLEDSIYAYSASYSDREVLEERLTLVGKTSEKDLFTRLRRDGNDEIKQGGFLKTAEDRKFFEFIARGTRANQLFLRETIERNCDWFRPVFNWFKDKLIIIYPETMADSFEQLISPNLHLGDDFHSFFEMLGLGIEGVEVRPLELTQSRAQLPEPLVATIAGSLPPGMSTTVFNIPGGRFRFSKNADGVLSAFKLVLKHRIGESDDYVDFEVAEESDGTKRLLDLIPMLMDLAETERIFLVDEIDRSMHAQLSRAFFEFFFANSKERSQVLATTHELDLLDLELFRKDEIWFVEKDRMSASHLYSLEEFKPRYDKDVRRGYLQGRFGAIPVVRGIKGTPWKT